MRPKMRALTAAALLAGGLVVTATPYTPAQSQDRRDDRAGDRVGDRPGQKIPCKLGDEKKRPECRLQDKRDNGKQRDQRDK